MNIFHLKEQTVLNKELIFWAVDSPLNTSHRGVYELNYSSYFIPQKCRTSEKCTCLKQQLISPSLQLQIWIAWRQCHCHVHCSQSPGSLFLMMRSEGRFSRWSMFLQTWFSPVGQVLSDILSIILNQNRLLEGQVASNSFRPAVVRTWTQDWVTCGGCGW